MNIEHVKTLCNEVLDTLDTATRAEAVEAIRQRFHDSSGGGVGHAKRRTCAAVLAVLDEVAAERRADYLEQMRDGFERMGEMRGDLNA